MKCLNCGKTAETFLCRDCQTTEILDKVFNEIRGYCAEYPFLADLEKKLEKEGLYDEFKFKFKSINGDNSLTSIVLACSSGLLERDSSEKNLTFSSKRIS